MKFCDWKETLNAELARLTPREEQVVRMRFGIGEESDYTLKEVGQRFGLTKERIRQIETKAIRRLTHLEPFKPNPFDFHQSSGTS